MYGSYALRKIASLFFQEFCFFGFCVSKPDDEKVDKEDLGDCQIMKNKVLYFSCYGSSGSNMYTDLHGLSG